MLLEYIAIAVMIAVATFIAIAAIGLGELFGPKKNTEAKSLPTNSGMSPYGEGTRRMPVRFYLIAVLFILFDIEVVFFLPWAIAFRQLGILACLKWLCLSLSYWLDMCMPGRKELWNGSRAKTR